MKRITRANIMGELVDKFSLQEYEREDFLFGEFVVPIYDIGAHVRHWVPERFRVQVTGNGDLIAAYVPDNEQWHIRKIDVMNEAGGNFDIDQVYLYKSALQAQYVFYNTTTPLPAGTVTIFSFPQDIVATFATLAHIHVNIANFVAGGWVTLHVLKEVEILR